MEVTDAADTARLFYFSPSLAIPETKKALSECHSQQ